MLTVSMRDGTWVKVKADRFEIDGIGYLYAYDESRLVALFAIGAWSFVQSDAA